MSSFPIEGTITGTPFTDPTSGTVRGSRLPDSGTVHGSDNGRVHGSESGRVHGSSSGTLAGETAESPQSEAIAELSTLISSLSSLATQAQGLPLSPPSLPGLPQSGYQPQSTDYTQFAGDAE
ncbi:MAG: hypothetical protein JOZ77_01690 [Candidatus Eremiobacteraeota bacterium]|nr:hypothetical protein [Candidatus Eremiobacteraeota bacterium]